MSRLPSALVVLYMLLSARPAHAQDANALLQDGLRLYGEKQYAAAVTKLDGALAVVPDLYYGLIGKGFALVDLDRLAEGRVVVEKALLVGDIDENSIPRMLAYMAILERDDLAEAKRWIDRAASFWTGPADLANFEEECATYGKKRHAATFAALAAHGRERLAALEGGRAAAAERELFVEAAGLLEGGSPAAVRAKVDAAVTRALARPGVSDAHMVHVLLNFGLLVAERGGEAEAVGLLGRALEHHARHKVANPYLAARAALNLARIHNATGRRAEAVEIVDRHLAAGRAQPFPHLLGEMVQERLAAHAALLGDRKRPSEKGPIVTDAQLLLEIARSSPHRAAHEAIAHNALAGVYLFGTNAERATARRHADQALAAARASGREPLVADVLGNLAITQFQAGQHTEGTATARESAALARKHGRHLDAALGLNNLGAMLLLEGKVDAAVGPLTEAVRFIEDARKEVPADRRIAFLEEQVSAYRFLAMAHGKLDRARELYDTLEASRARVLAETLGLGAGLARGDLAWLTANLAADEAAVLYGVTEPGAVAIVVVTREGIRSIYVEQRDLVARLQKRLGDAYGIALRLPAGEPATFDPFRQRGVSEIGQLVAVLRELMQDSGKLAIAPALRDEILGVFHGFLIAPIEPLVAGKKRLLISPDEFLSFVPLEGLRAPGGKYLVETHAVRHVPSIAVYRAVRERRLPEGRKAMLAFGGATYAPYTASVELVRDEPGHRALRAEVLANAAAGRSQRQAYAALGITGASWKYLPGTLEEVAAIQKVVPDVTAFFGDDFSEARLKQMSRSGELARYRVLHLATHGVVVPTLPELSTVITTLAAADGAEDGYLNAAEVRGLRLAADFVALSACETGLGKVFAGEGVAGLMESFLVAGANGLSVSLWAISDDATMRFMTGLYQLAHEQKLSFADAMVEMKRRFVRGDFGERYRQPGFWAPFAYYGI